IWLRGSASVLLAPHGRGCKGFEACGICPSLSVSLPGDSAWVHTCLFPSLPVLPPESWPAPPFDALKRLAIDAGRAAVPLGSTVSLFEGLGLRDMYEETPEAMRPIRLRLSIDPSPQILQTDGWFCHLTPASLCRTAYSPVRALPSGRVLLPVHRQYYDPIRQPDACA